MSIVTDEQRRLRGKYGPPRSGCFQSPISSVAALAQATSLRFARLLGYRALETIENYAGYEPAASVARARRRERPWWLP